LTGLHLPAAVIRTARESLGTAKIVATHAPEAVRPVIVRAANHGFLDGFTAGTRVAAGAAALGVLVALVALPARARDQRDLPLGSLPDAAVAPEQAR
jgi:hypothetical protein